MYHIFIFVKGSRMKNYILGSIVTLVCLSIFSYATYLVIPILHPDLYNNAEVMQATGTMTLLCMSGFFLGGELVDM